MDISEDELKKIFENYPPLNDGIGVETKKEIKEDYIYYGEWSAAENTRHGRGIQLWKDGTRYEGYWKNDKQDVKGFQSWPDGRTYEGDYKEGKKNGIGIFKYSNGDIYEGDWKDDKKEGSGTLTFSDGISHTGTWVDDEIDGPWISTMH